LTEGEAEKSELIEITNQRDIHGRKHGFWRWRHTNERISSTENFIQGKRHGIHRGWHKNGVLCFEDNYVHGIPHGYWKFWNDDGKPACFIFHFVNGIKEGEEIDFNNEVK
jgi:antitoxin component YwqK of YwqJK toxin-antitoxin module